MSTETEAKPRGNTPLYIVVGIYRGKDSQRLRLNSYT